MYTVLRRDVVFVDREELHTCKRTGLSSPRNTIQTFNATNYKVHLFPLASAQKSLVKVYLSHCDDSFFVRFRRP